MLKALAKKIRGAAKQTKSTTRSVQNSRRARKQPATSFELGMLAEGSGDLIVGKGIDDMMVGSGGDLNDLIVGHPGELWKLG